MSRFNTLKLVQFLDTNSILYVRLELDPTVCFEIDAEAGDNNSWAEDSRHTTIRVWESDVPEVAGISIAMTRIRVGRV